jgi:hypothetical protein
MGVLPVAVEGAGDLREPLLMLGWLPFGEMTGLELLRLKIPMANSGRRCEGESEGWKVRWMRSHTAFAEAEQ